MINQEYNNAAVAASLSLSCHPACALQGSEGRDLGDNKAFSITPSAGAPPPLVDGFPTNYIYLEPVKAMVKEKYRLLTSKPLTVAGWSRWVNWSRHFQHIAHVRARACVSLFFFLINIFYYYEKCFDQCVQPSIDADFALTIYSTMIDRLDHKGLLT